jgi:hypothetical protein
MTINKYEINHVRYFRDLKDDQDYIQKLMKV